ncbi:MAG: hypothetical protein C0392_00525 [Syntrophus sp. (in: bacteria)]|nr:hypothetical protein [Syntrophus sp. (in: bacteria)]
MCERQFKVLSSMFKVKSQVFNVEHRTINYPAAELRGISGMRNMITPPHPTLSHEGRGGYVYPEAELRGIY